MGQAQVCYERFKMVVTGVCKTFVFSVLKLEASPTKLKHFILLFEWDLILPIFTYENTVNVEGQQNAVFYLCIWTSKFQVKGL